MWHGKYSFDYRNKLQFNTFTQKTSVLRYNNICDQINEVLVNRRATCDHWPGRAWRASVRRRPPSPAACRTAGPRWSRCKERRGQRSGSPAASWLLALLCRAPDETNTASELNAARAPQHRAAGQRRTTLLMNFSSRFSRNFLEDSSEALFSCSCRRS